MPITHLIKSLTSLDSSSPYGRLLESQKTGGSRELFLAFEIALALSNYQGFCQGKSVFSLMYIGKLLS